LKTDDSDTSARRQLIRAAKQREREQGRRGLRRLPPRPRRPEGIRREYRSDIRRLVKRQGEEINRILKPELESFLVEAGTRGDAEYSDSWSDRVGEIMEAVRSNLSNDVQGLEERLPEYANRITEHTDEDVKRQLRAVVGVSPTLTRSIDDKVDSWVATNSSLIRTLNEEQIGEVERIVQREVRRGSSVREITRKINKQVNNGNYRAERIARTESGQLYAQISRERNRELGISKFEWVTARDERVRDQHDAWGGHKFEWDNPPDGVRPGEPINCRCSARSDVDGLLDELEAE